MSLLLLFAYPNPASIPIGELVTTAPSASNGFAIQQSAVSGEWRWVVELADPADGASAIWRDITTYYVGDRHQFGADTYKGDARARLVQVQLQIDDSDMLAPWGQNTSSIFGTNVRLDAGMLMRASFARVDTGVVVEWLPIWTGRVESWGDESGARGQVRRHVVSVVDTIADLANVPTVVLSAAATWPEYVENQLLPAAGWLFGVDIYGDAASSGGPFDDVPQAAINRLDGITDFQGLVWRSLRAGRLVIHPAPWDTTNVTRYPNPLLDVYPDGLKFSYTPDFTDIEYIADDDQQPFGIERTVAGIINFITITYPGDFGPETYPTDDPVSIGRYGVRPMTASWLGWNGPQTVEDILNDRAFSSSQAMPLRTTLDHEGFWSAMAIVDHLDPVTIVHATSDEGLVVTATGTVRNIVEERTFRGEAGGDYALSWQSTVQVDLDATETSPALLPVEDLAFISSESSGSAGPSTAEFTWTNPVQPDVTPTEVQMRVLPRSFIWSSEDYPGVGADGTTINWLEAGQYYTLQVRLIRRVNGVIVAASAIRQVRFFTPNRIFPIPIPGTDPGDTDVIGEPPDDDCDDFQIDLQENDGTGWVTVDTFTGAELTDNGDGTFSLTTPIPNSFFNDGSMYRFRSSCDGIDWIAGPAFDPPDDWTDPCTTPPALSSAPFNSSDLLVYVPKICAPDIIREAVSGLEATHGGALDAIVSGVGDPEDRALLALADPAWSDAAGGILAYGECPQVVGHVGDRSISVRVMVDTAEDCVLFEVGGMRLTCVQVSGGWRAAVIVYKVGLTITLPTATVLDEGTAYVITATHILATGDISLYVDGVVDNTVAGSDNVNIIAALPIWRVGAPPESWITDAALWKSNIYALGPTVTINQGSGQSDPAFGATIVFDVVFSQAVTGFATGDVTLTGTAGATTATVVDSGDHIHFTVNVTGMSVSGGTVTATIAGGVCTGTVGGLPNVASTSTDNTVQWGSLYTDPFTRGDNANIADASHPWRQPSGFPGLQIVSNTLRGPSSAAAAVAIWNIDLGSDDNFIEFDVVSTTADVLFYIRASNASLTTLPTTYYEVYWTSGSGGSLVTRATGVTKNTTTGVGSLNGKRLRAQIQGTAIKVYIDGGLVVSFTDATIASGRYVGVRLDVLSSIVDNMTCGSL